MTQPFPLACPCGQMLLVDPVDCGSLLRCPTCSGIVVVPDGPPAESIVIDTTRGGRPPKPPARTAANRPAKKTARQRVRGFLRFAAWLWLGSLALSVLMGGVVWARMLDHGQAAARTAATAAIFLYGGGLSCFCLFIVAVAAAVHLALPDDG